ncbi:MAG: hypothetical protein C5B58_15620 [Acidobacteria bacterium]|nr:MAG: hypothetical protein C5B58_15620 [Acidobacteriota bacterium]
MLGRPLRILHIGNIANNAYNNARIQRQYGIEADVCCHDYYHVMATPEWEDGGVTSEVDPNLPNWWETNLRGFQRPGWYVQGPLHLCLDYLDARGLGQQARMHRAAYAIEDAYIAMLKKEAILQGRPWSDPRRNLGQRQMPWTVPRSYLLVTAIAEAPQRLISALMELRTLVLWPLLAAAIADPPRIKGSRFVLNGYGALCRLLKRPAPDNITVANRAAALVPAGVDCSWGGAMRRLAKIGPAIGRALLALPLVRPARVINHLRWPTGQPPSIAVREAKTCAVIEKIIERERWLTLPTERREMFRNRIAHHALLFDQVLKYYDIVQGYSIDGFIPLVNGHKAFASYEHGTLRSIPFEDNLTGLVCEIAYKHSPVVFVTNVDVLPSVDRLKLPPETVYYLPHAFDDRKIMNWRERNRQFMPSKDQIVFFSATRQDWRDGNPSLTKGNDMMLRAAGRLWSEGHRFRLVLVEWGRNVKDSKELIHALGYSEAVEWVQPMGKQRLWETFCCSHAVLDQFAMRVMGGIGFEVMALGRPLISAIDADLFAHFFGAAPPYLGANSMQECYAQMLQVINDPQDAKGVGAAETQWMKEYHSARRIVEIQGKAYERLLALGSEGKRACA